MSKSWWILIIGLVSLLLAQIIKFVINSIKAKKLSFKTLKSTGDFPSSHISFVLSMSMAVLVLNEFIVNDLFFVSLIITIIFIFDASGVRFESKKHAKAINEINRQLKLKDDTYKYEELKEELGHKWFEVLGGLLLGVIVALLIGIMVIS